MSSNSLLELQQPRYMNTYKLWSDKPFNPEKVQKILEVVMIEAFENLVYDQKNCESLALTLSDSIKSKVKEMEFDRFIQLLVTIGEKISQDILITASGLWDKDRDRYVFYSIENNNVFGVAQCFGLYYE